mmetsp:Transcript_22748/g.50278  ORF Transcript_22748/g.50278 Transcript_22748/m.50278 type:complete len:215 (-) Transcript_22748:1335-1979(-)
MVNVQDVCVQPDLDDPDRTHQLTVPHLQFTKLLLIDLIVKLCKGARGELRDVYPTSLKEGHQLALVLVLDGRPYPMPRALLSGEGLDGRQPQFFHVPVGLALDEDLDVMRPVGGHDAGYRLGSGPLLTVLIGAHVYGEARLDGLAAKVEALREALLYDFLPTAAVLVLQVHGEHLVSYPDLAAIRGLGSDSQLPHLVLRVPHPQGNAHQLDYPF